MSGTELQTRAWNELVVVKKTKYIDSVTFMPKLKISLDISLEALLDLSACGFKETAVLEHLKNKLQDVYLQ